MKTIDKPLESIGFYTLYDERATNSSPTSQMKRCEMIITEACNFKCPYCRGLKPEIYSDRQRKMLSLQEIKTGIDLWCLNGTLENIRFSGGEPTLHPDILAAVQYAKSKGIKRIAISSNGSNKMELYKKLVEAGANDFSISLDACCAINGDKMAGNINKAWEKVVKTISELSKLTYVTTGVVLTPDNIEETMKIVAYADSLGVADIRIIPSAQWNKFIDEVKGIPEEILERHPILKYRVSNIREGRHIRGITETDANRCYLALDDSIIAGQYHFPCVIHMREGGQPIGKVGPTMRADKVQWAMSHDTFKDPICQKNCLDICIHYNNTCRRINKFVNA